MSDEKLRLCRSFDELREGMLVVFSMLNCCGKRRHRAMISDGPRVGEVNNIFHPGEPSFLFQPDCGCSNPAYIPRLCPCAVTSGRISIVETGNDDEAEREDGRRDVKLHPAANEHFRQRMGIDK